MTRIENPRGLSTFEIVCLDSRRYLAAFVTAKGAQNQGARA
jgi:hypothetical protein